MPSHDAHTSGKGLWCTLAELPCDVLATVFAHYRAGLHHRMLLDELNTLIRATDGDVSCLLMTAAELDHHMAH